MVSPKTLFGSIKRRVSGGQSQQQQQRNAPEPGRTPSDPSQQQHPAGAQQQPNHSGQAPVPPHKPKASGQAASIGQQQSARTRMAAHFIVWPVELIRAELPKWTPNEDKPAIDDGGGPQKEGKDEGNSAASGKEESAAKANPPKDEEEAGWLGIEFKARVDGHLVITNIMPGGPAHGINTVMIGDLIVGIRGFLARALTPPQMAELAKGRAGTKLSLLLGAEYMGGKYSYTTQHVLKDGSRVPVHRVKVVQMQNPSPRCMEPDVELLSPGVVQLGAMRHGQNHLPEAEDMMDDDIATVQRMMSNGGAEGEDETEDATSDNTEEAKSINDNDSTTSQTTSA